VFPNSPRGEAVAKPVLSCQYPDSPLAKTGQLLFKMYVFIVLKSLLLQVLLRDRCDRMGRFTRRGS
jgi:hypothetical protein